MTDAPAADTLGALWMLRQVIAAVLAAAVWMNSRRVMVYLLLDARARILWRPGQEKLNV